MNKLTWFFYIILIFIFPVSLSAYDLKTTSISSSYRYSYHRTNGFKNEIFIQGKQDISEHFLIGSGFSTAFNALPERFYFNIDLVNFPSFLRYRISLLSREFPDYEITENSIYPTIALLTRYFEMELGASFRFPVSLEQSMTIQTLYRIQLNVINLKQYTLSLKLSNFDSFRADNITSLYYTLQNKIIINDHYLILADFGIHNAGQLAFSSFFTSLFGQIGFRYSL